MKRISIIISLLVVLSMHYSCNKKDVIDPGFEDALEYTIYDYIVENKEEYSSFLKILEVSGLDRTLSAYNPGGKTGGFNYTLFLPDNQAVEAFIQENEQYATFEDLLNDQAYVEALARYHVVNQGVKSNDFPFGTFSQPTLSNDYLSVNFDVRTDTTFYKINNQANVIKANIEVSNGYIQVIGGMLRPITLNSYGWLKRNTDYSIFTAAIEATGIDDSINVDMKLEDQTLMPFTILVEADSIYHKRNINSFEDLANLISPGNSDYTHPKNPLNIYVGYHLLTGSYFLDKLVGANTNFNNFADIPLRINGEGIEIVINKSPLFLFVDGKDTTDFIGLYYDESNVNTQSGPIHFVNQIMEPRTPTKAEVGFEFWDEPVLEEYRRLGGTFIIENPEMMKHVTWSGAELSYVKSLDVNNEDAWSDDYLQLDGDFTITYNIPKVIAGKYDVFLWADCFNERNAVVEVYVDGIKSGSLIDLTKIGNADWVYRDIKVGTVDFKRYEGHSIQIKSLIPGRFIWDAIQFKPI